MKLNLLPRREPAGERYVVAGAEPIRHLILATVVLGLSVPVPTLAAGDRAGTGTGREGQPVRSLLEMRRDKVVVQDWDLSCGAAALATLLAYQHGDSVPERKVAKGMIRREEYLADPSRVQKGGGFSLLDLKRYVDRRGYEGVGYGQLAFEHLIEFAPIIVPLSLNGYDHFVVFRGIWGDRVLLADPAWGNRVMSVEGFEDAWLDFPEFGKVGFVVQRRDGAEPPNQLAPKPGDFLISPPSIVRTASR